jgi:hypothetical protein
MADVTVTESTFGGDDPLINDLVDVLNKHAATEVAGIMTIDAIKVLAALGILSVHVLAGIPDEHREAKIKEYFDAITDGAQALREKRAVKVLGAAGCA